MEDIVIIGAGGFAREVRFLIEDINNTKSQYNILGYLVSDLNKTTKTDSINEIIGSIDWIRKFDKKINIALGIGNPEHRLSIGRLIMSEYPNAQLVSLIHPNVVFDRKSCRIGRGVLICANCILTVNVTLGDYSMLNLACTVGHEAVIGEGVVMNPAVNISGGVTVGEGVLIGTGAQVLQYLTIGAYAKVGAAAMVRKNVEPGDIIVGIPAKSIKRKISSNP